MTTGKNRGSTYEMIVLNDSEYCKTLMQTQRKINDEIKMNEWLQCLFKINAGTLELKPKEAWEVPSNSNNQRLMERNQVVMKDADHFPDEDRTHTSTS